LKSVWNVKLKTLLHIISNLRMYGSIPLSPYYFMTWFWAKYCHSSFGVVQSDVDENSLVPGYDVVSMGKPLQKFRRNVMPSTSGSRGPRRTKKTRKALPLFETVGTCRPGTHYPVLKARNPYINVTVQLTHAAWILKPLQWRNRSLLAVIITSMKYRLKICFVVIIISDTN
jgi:hypothetical protein